MKINSTFIIITFKASKNTFYRKYIGKIFFFVCQKNVWVKRIFFSDYKEYERRLFDAHNILFVIFVRDKKRRTKKFL